MNWWITGPCRVCGKRDCGLMIKGLCLLCVDVAIDYCDKHNYSPNLNNTKNKEDNNGN